MISGNRWIVRLTGLAACIFVSTASVSSYGGVAWQTVASGPDATAAFETGSNWAAPDYDPIPSIGPELTPPGAASTWFIEGAADDPDTAENDSRPSFNGTITLTQNRDGSDLMHPKLGAGSVGGGISNEVTTLVIAANVTITGAERQSNGELSTTVRQFRVGQQDWTDNNVFPWGIVKQTTGTVILEMAGDPTRGDLLITNDKTLAAGGIWEVGGTASLDIATDMQMGNKVGVKAPGGIFRIRGSEVGSVTVGDRFQVQSQTATWDVTEVDLGGGLRHKFNRGKSVLEFVLDTDGVTPLTVEDNISIGSNGTVTTPTLGTTTAILPGFLRVKLSQPTTKGMGTYNPADPGSGDVIVLVESDRIDTAITAVPVGAEELLEGRFFEPDHTNDAGTSPHRALLNGFRINSDYAGAVYSWVINYYEDATIQNGIVTPSVILSGLQITGTPGDLNGDTLLDEMDRTALVNAIASPPVTDYNLLNAPQNLYDLNADDHIDELDLDTFNTYFLAPANIPGDHNADGIVDTADYVMWRKTDAGNIQGYNDWRTHFGEGGSGAGGSGAVPEPASVMFAVIAGCTVLCGRRRTSQTT